MNYHHHHRNQRILLGGLAAAVLTLAACSGPGGGSGGSAPSGGSDWGDASGTVTFWDSNANEQLTAQWKTEIAAFESSHPKITVNYVGLPNSSYLQKVNNAIATGDTPDVLLIGNDVGGLIAQNVLEPLDAKFASSGLADKVDPTMVSTERQNSAGGKLFKAPLTALSDVIWYRTDWLKTAGLSAPTTYDELFADAKQLTQKDKNKFGWAFRGGAGSSAPLFAMTYGMSGVGQFFDTNGKATLDDPANIAALKKYVSLYGSVSASADVSNDYPKMVAEFDGGSAFAMHHNLGSYQDHVAALGADDVAGVQPFPNADGTITATTPAISGLSIFAKSKHKEAAWEFVQYMSTDGNSDWAKASGQVPANVAAQSDAWVKASQPLAAIVETSKNPKTQYLRLPTYLPQYGTIIKTEMEPDFQTVLQGKMTVDAFAKKYADEFTKAQAEYKANPPKS